MQAKSLIQLYLDHSRCTGKIHKFFQSFEAAYRSKTFIFFLFLFIIIFISHLQNTVFGSMLIGNEHFQPKSLTECLKPALYIHFIFVALVWFCLALEVELSKPTK